MKRYLCLFVAIVMCLMSIPAFAMSLSFEEIKNIIDSTAVDDVHMFTDMQHFSDGGINSDAAYISEGIALMWYEDIQQAEVLLFSSSNAKEGYKWYLAEAGMQYIRDAVLILSVISEYNAEPIFTFISTDSTHNAPLQYLSDHKPNTDSEKFADEVAAYIKNNIAENTETVGSEATEAKQEEYIALQRGDKGDNVVVLQKRLNELGYSVGTVDGDFGGKTHNAVCDFQRDNDLEATGIVDAELNALIFSTTAKTKAEVEALKNSPEGFRLDIAAAKAIGDKFASGSFNGSDKCTSNESSSDYRFYVQDYDTKNGELQISCSLDKAKGANNIDANISVEYIIPLGSGLWRSEPNMVVISTNKGSHTLPSSMWSWLAGSVYIDFDEDISLFKEIAGASEFNIVLSNSNPSTLTYGSFSKNSVGFKGIKTAWNIWEAAGCNKLMEMK